MDLRNRFSTPHGLYMSCCSVIIALALVPPLIALSYGALNEEMPEIVQEMRAVPYYKPIILKDGAIGSDLYQSYIFARVWEDGLSPYGSVPDIYFKDYNFRNYKWGKLPLYSPMTYWLYSKLVPMDYTVVYRIHTTIKVVFLLLAAIIVLWVFGARKLILPTVYALVSCIFASPIGLTELMRGQFELFSATAFMLAYAMLFYPRPLWAIFGGVMASYKLSSLTFLGPFSAVAFLVHRKRFNYFALLIAAMFCVLFLFFPHLVGFTRYIFAHEIIIDSSIISSHFQPAGISFTSILPFYVGKSVILLSTAFVLAVLLCIRKAHRRVEVFLAASFPFAVMLMLQAAGFGLRAWEYKGMTLLALLPGLYLWLQMTSVREGLKRLTACLFTVLLAIVLHLFPFKRAIIFGNTTDMAWVYFYASGIFFVLTMVVIGVYLLDSSTQRRNA